MLVVTYNIEIQMNNDSYSYWSAFLNEARNAYNFCAKHIVENNVSLNLHDVHDAVYGIMREKFPMIPAQGIIKTYKEVISAFRSIKKNKHKDAKNPERKNLAMRLDKRLYANLSVEGVALTGEIRNKRSFYPFVKFPKMQELFASCVTRDPLIFIRDGRIFLSVPFEMAELPLQGNDSIGVDLGVRRLFVTSEGKAFRDKKYLARRRKIRNQKRSLKCNGSKSAKKKLKKLKHKERNLSKDMCMRASQALLASTDASVIVMEDLSKLKENTKKTKDGFKRKRHNSVISQVPFYQFKEILAHKAALSGRKVITVSPIDTSQEDSRSGKKNGTRKGCRYYCHDGIVLDADWNAAINIAKRGKHPSSNSIPKDGMLQFLNGRELSTSQRSRYQGTSR